MPKPRKTQFKMRLAQEEAEWLHELAEFQGMSAEDYVKRLIRQHRFALQQAAAEEIERRAAIRRRKKVTARAQSRK
jgi:hypothetical protein